MLPQPLKRFQQAQQFKQMLVTFTVMVIYIHHHLCRYTPLITTFVDRGSIYGDDTISIPPLQGVKIFSDNTSTLTFVKLNNLYIIHRRAIIQNVLFDLEGVKLTRVSKPLKRPQGHHRVSQKFPEMFPKAHTLYPMHALGSSIVWSFSCTEREREVGGGEET